MKSILKYICLIGSIVVLSISTVQASTTYTITDNEDGTYTVKKVEGSVTEYKDAENTEETEVEISTDDSKVIESNSYTSKKKLNDIIPKTSSWDETKILSGLGGTYYSYSIFQELLNNGFVSKVYIGDNYKTFVALIADEEIYRPNYYFYGFELPRESYTTQLNFIKEMDERGIEVDYEYLRKMKPQYRVAITSIICLVVVMVGSICSSIKRIVKNK